jgi:L-arabinose isomerase
MSRPPRVALLSPYWSFFEPNVPFDLRADRVALAATVAEALDGVEVVAQELVDSRERGEEAAARIAAAAPDALLVVQSMAVPPAYTLAALDRLAELPLVVFVVHRRDRVGDAFSHADITTEGATVGGPQLTNVLHRRGRSHALVVGRLHDPACRAELRTETLAATVAGRLRGARIARVGEPIDGYDCVDADPDALHAATGITLVPVAPGEVRDAYLHGGGADAEAVAAIEAEVRAGWQLVPGVEDDECLARSVRFAAALERLDADLGVAAGAMNCHVPEIRFSDDPGITPCFALGRETSRGIPWSCAGDVVTVVAMLTTKLLGGAALYHEIEALDHESGEALLANSGEHDLAWRDPGRPAELRRNVWWDEADPRCGACACFGPPAGPATLVAFTPHHAEPSGFRFVIAEGELTARTFPQTGTANGAFVFGDGSDAVAQAWKRWAQAGANHHSSATPGHLGDAVAAVAAQLGVGAVRVS